MFQELDNKGVRTVLNSYDVLGGPHTFNVISTTKVFYEANPKVNRAVLAAIEEADEFIRKNRKAAAEIYIKSSGTKESPSDLLSQLNNPALGYSSTPTNWPSRSRIGIANNCCQPLSAPGSEYLTMPMCGARAQRFVITRCFHPTAQT